MHCMLMQIQYNEPDGKEETAMGELAYEQIMNQAKERLLTASPKEILSWTPQQLKRAIIKSEGRTIMGYGRVRAANLIDYVCNPELVAAFGADIVLVNCFDMNDPIIPGLNSKDLSQDEATRQIQVPLGKGYSLKELRELIGRPVGVLLVATPGEADDRGQVFSYGEVKATVANALKAVESGADLLNILGWGDTESLVKTIKEIKEAVKDKALIGFFRPHGPGLMGVGGKTGADLVGEEEVVAAIEAGADIIGIPAPGAHYGWSVEKCTRLVDLIHEHGAVASVGIHTSQEGSDEDTIRQIALWAKMTGADMHELGDIGYNECMVLPENILTYGVAIRGRRHQYRRMAMSINR